MTAKRSDAFLSKTQALLADAGVAARINESDVVVLERIARGGGETRWYHFQRSASLSNISALLSPGSAVSFYFGDRITRGAFDAAIQKELAAICHRAKEAFVAAELPSGPVLTTYFVAGEKDIADLDDDIPPGTTVYFGEYPGRENDGTVAVFLLLPDQDGIVRPHPH